MYHFEYYVFGIYMYIYIFAKHDSFFFYSIHFPTCVTEQELINYTGWKRNSLTPRTTTFPCPGCEHDVDLGERGINGLFRNFTLETIVERYRQAARAATAIMCDLCKPPPQESTKSCMDCSASYCNECFKIYHPWGTVKAQHEYVGPTTNFRPKVSEVSMKLVDPRGGGARWAAICGVTRSRTRLKRLSSSSVVNNMRR